VSLSKANFTVAAGDSTRTATELEEIVPDLIVTATSPALTPVRVNTASPLTIVAAVPESDTVAILLEKALSVPAPTVTPEASFATALTVVVFAPSAITDLTGVASIVAMSP